MSYSVLYSENGITKDISDFISKIDFSGDRQSAARKLDVSLLSGTDVFVPRLNLRNGGLLTVLSGQKELIRAIIFKQDRNDKGEFTVSGYTHGIYLTKNKDTLHFSQVKASQIIQQLCADFRIIPGEIVDTQVVIPKLMLRDKTLWDMMLIALTETTKTSGIEYRIFFKEGKLNVCEKRRQLVPLILEEGVNLLSASKSISIEDMRNRLILVGKLPQENGGELKAKVENAEMQRLYGLMQETVEETVDQLTDSALKQRAEERLKDLAKEAVEANIEALGMDEVEAGMAVYVIESSTGLTGSYYIEQDSHSIEGNSHRMSLKLSLTDEVPKLEYEGGES